jgi:hypothetical protein
VHEGRKSRGEHAARVGTWLAYDRFGEKASTKVGFGVLDSNIGFWTSPVNEIAKLHARNLTLK